MRVSKQAFFSMIVMLYLFVSQAVTGYANNAVTTRQWQQLTNDTSFRYRTDIEPIKQVATVHRSKGFEKFLAAIFAFFSGDLGTILIWLIVCGVLLYLLYQLIVKNGGVLFGKRKQKLSDEQLAESEDIAGTNWEALLQQAAAGNDMRSAIRYSYMWLLQLLQQRELIRYRTDKTNYEYAVELAATTYRQPFRQLSRQYEYAWYGKYPLSPADYSNYMQLFNDVRKKLER